MSTNAISQLEQEILRILKDEYSFYQSLYILLDRQRDSIRYKKDEHLLDLYAEIERCKQRIRESEEKISALKTDNPQMFKVAAVHPQVKKLVNSIVTLVKKNMSVVAENEAYLTDRYERIKSELNELKNSRKILQYVRDIDPSPQFVDGKN
jgi:homoserine dehydrogenase